MCFPYPLLQAKTDRPTGRGNESVQPQAGLADPAKEKEWEYCIVIIFGLLQVAS